MKVSSQGYLVFTVLTILIMIVNIVKTFIASDDSIIFYFFVIIVVLIPLIYKRVIYFNDGFIDLKHLITKKTDKLELKQIVSIKQRFNPAFFLLNPYIIKYIDNNKKIRSVSFYRRQMNNKDFEKFLFFLKLVNNKY